MFVRRLVSGVRSSCEASATSWRWAATEASSAATERPRRSSIVLKLEARRLSSSAPESSMRALRSWVSATCSAASVSAAHGRHRRAGPPPERGGEPDAAEADDEQDDAQAPEHVVDLVQRAGDLDRAAARQRRREDPHMRAGHIGVAQVGPPTAAGELGDASVDGQRHGGRPARGSIWPCARGRTAGPAGGLRQADASRVGPSAGGGRSRRSAGCLTGR